MKPIQHPSSTPPSSDDFHNYGSMDDKTECVVPPSRTEHDNDTTDRNPTHPSSALEQRTGGRSCSKSARILFLVVAALTGLLVVSNNTMFSHHSSSLSSSIALMMVQRNTKHTKKNQCIFTNVHCNQQQKECYIKPSEYEACLQNIRLDTKHALQTIQSLDDIFAQYYPFYYLARSPNRTVPMIPHRQELVQRNVRIYDREYDLHAQLQSLQADVLAKDEASIATFWNVTATFNLLRDAHVSAVKGTIGQLTSDFWSGRYEMIVLPSAVLRKFNAHHSRNQHKLLQTDFYYATENESSEVVVGLDLWRYSYTKDKNGIDTDDNLRLYAKQQVTRVDGLSPWDFVLRLAHDAPLASITFKSVGPRVNSLLFRNFASTQPTTTFFRTRPGRKERIWPSDVMPNDSFRIEYNKGRDGQPGREEFDARIVITPSDYSGVNDVLLQKTATTKPSGERLVVDITDIEKAANAPSCLYRHFMDGMKGEAVAHVKYSVHQRNFADTANNSNQENASKDYPVNILDQYCTCSQDGWFTKHYNCSGFAPPFDDDGPFEAAWKVMDDSFVVFWIDSFDAPPEIIFPLWSEMTRVARKAGVERLMIDISNNGGGEVPMGLNLARLLYPEVACEFFDNAYDMVYNQAMRVWASDVDPLLRQIESELLDGDVVLGNDDVVLGNEMLIVLAKATAKQRQDIVRRAEAMCIFALDRKDGYCGIDAKQTVQANCTLHLAAVQVDTDPSLASLNEFLREYLLAMRSGNPWTVDSNFGVSDKIEEETYLRGGMKANFTGFLKHEPDLPVWWNCSLEQVNDADNVFSQYILVSNGNAGSTTNTFQTTVEQLWKNREITKARRPLTTVSYGGVNGDTPLTQFAGGTLDASVNVEDAFVGLVGLRLLAEFVCGCTQDLLCSQVNEAFDKLSDSLPQVPFYLEKFPALPAGM